MEIKKKFYRTIVFSKTPLTGFYGFEDKFQIFPCDLKHIPKTKLNNVDQPLFMELWVDENVNPQIPTDLAELFKGQLASLSHMSYKAAQYCRILTILSNHHIYYPITGRLEWGCKMPSDEQLPNSSTSSVFARGFFLYPELANDCSISEFSPQSHQAVKSGSHPQYFLNDPIDSYKKVIMFPENINPALIKYFSLEKAASDKVNSVAQLFNNGIEIEERMKSLSFLAYVSAIETLMNYEYKNEFIGNCITCMQPVYSVSKKFKRFLKTYLSASTNSIKKYNNIYSLRSKIVHNGNLLLSDDQFDWSSSKKEESEYQIRISARQFARIVLINWLLNGPNLKPVED